MNHFLISTIGKIAIMGGKNDWSFFKKMTGHQQEIGEGFRNSGQIVTDEKQCCNRPDWQGGNEEKQNITVMERMKSQI
jgi:hypothetical protein